MSKQFQFKLVLLGTHPFYAGWLVVNIGRRRVCCWQVEVLPAFSHQFATLVHPRNSSAPSLVLRFVKDQFDDYRESTIGGEPRWSTCTEPSPTNIDPFQLRS